MVVVRDPIKRFCALSARGSLGWPCELGELVLGWSYFGWWTYQAGVYQRRTRFGRVVQVREKHFHPLDPYAGNRPVSQAKFAAAVAAWQGLAEEEKEEWRWRARKLCMTGFNLFIKNYMLS